MKSNAVPWRSWLALCGIWLLLAPERSAHSQAASGQVTEPRRPTPQLIPRTHEERERRYELGHRIILNVRVTDASGKAATELTEGDFTLLQDQRPQKIVSFRSVQGVTTIPPVHIILLLDTVNNSTRKLRTFGKEIEKYLRAGDRPLAYPVSIGLFTDGGVSMGTASLDRSALLEELKAADANLHETGCISNANQSEGLPHSAIPGIGAVRTKPSDALMCLNEQFTSSVTALNRIAQQSVTDPQRVILIWMGPGWPLLTNPEFREDDEHLKENFFQQLVELSTELREAQVTLDAVASPHWSLGVEAADVGKRAFIDGVSDASQVRAGNLGLHALAHQSGGLVLEDSKEIAAEIAACIADAQSYYALAFDAPPAAQFGEYHALEVKVNKPGLTVRTNTLYYPEQ